MIEQTTVHSKPSSRGRTIALASLQRLYDAAEQIRVLAPWDYLWESDIVTLVFPNRKEPMFCSITGLTGQNCSVGVYAGYDQMADFYRLTQLAGAELPYYIPMAYQNCLTCHFGERQELIKEDIEQIQRLGFKFRGKSLWPYFRSYQTGYFPWQIDADEAELMIMALEGLAEALQQMQQASIDVDFEGGETLYRQYDEETGAWQVFAAAMPPIPLTAGQILIDDEPLIAELLQRQQTATQLELELFYIPVPVEDERVPKPFYPRMALLADRQSGEMLDQCMLEQLDKNSEVLMGILLQYIFEFGRPTAIFVRDDKTEAIFWDLCRRLDIQLATSIQLPAVETIEEDMIQFVSRG